MSVTPSASVSLAAAPTQADLLDFARRTAADAELIASLPLDPEGRTWVRLEGPAGSEAWLIGWPPGSRTERKETVGSVGPAGSRRFSLPPGGFIFTWSMPPNGFSGTVPGFMNQRRLKTCSGASAVPKPISAGRRLLIARRTPSAV